MEQHYQEFKLRLAIRSKGGVVSSHTSALLSQIVRGDLLAASQPRAVPPDLNSKTDDVAGMYGKALRSLAGELACVREEERRKIADHLHDQLGQDLLVAKMKLSSLIETLPTKYRNRLEEVDQIIDEAVRDTRSVINELYPQLLYELGLKRAMEWLITQTQVKHGLVCKMRIDSIPGNLKEDIQLLLFQTVRELLMNIVKHARATKAEIVFGCDAGPMVIGVADDGQGFNPQSGFLSDVSIGRFGLFSVRARLKSLGGDLRIDSRMGKGTKVTVTIPRVA